MVSGSSGSRGSKPGKSTKTCGVSSLVQQGKGVGTLVDRRTGGGELAMDDSFLRLLPWCFSTEPSSSSTPLHLPSLQPNTALPPIISTKCKGKFSNVNREGGGRGEGRKDSHQFRAWGVNYMGRETIPTYAPLPTSVHGALATVMGVSREVVGDLVRGSRTATSFTKTTVQAGIDFLAKHRAYTPKKSGNKPVLVVRFHRLLGSPESALQSLSQTPVYSGKALLLSSMLPPSLLVKSEQISHR